MDGVTFDVKREGEGQQGNTHEDKSNAHLSLPSKSSPLMDMIAEGDARLETR